jgi:hypothetical protein
MEGTNEETQKEENPQETNSNQQEINSNQS